MCTLIMGIEVLGPGSVILGANRDEDPARPSDPPAMLAAKPRVVGGRDRLAGGTWLGIRERRAAVAMLNRRDSGAASDTDRAARRSRGLLALDVAGAAAGSGPGAEAPLADRALARTHELIAAGVYAPFSLAFLSPERSWVLSHDPGDAPPVTTLTRGWHVLTHADLDDPSEPRTARLMSELRGWRPASAHDAERGLIARLSEHGGNGAPAVCIHEGRMVTVSSSIVTLGPEVARYRHAEGRPCERPAEDLSRLLGGAAGVAA